MLNPRTRKISQIEGEPDAAPDLAGALLEMSVPKGPVAGGYVSRKITTEQLKANMPGGPSTPGSSSDLSFYKLDDATGQPLVVVAEGSSKKLSNYRIIVFRPAADGHRTAFPYPFPSPF